MIIIDSIKRVILDRIISKQESRLNSLDLMNKLLVKEIESYIFKNKKEIWSIDKSGRYRLLIKLSDDLYLFNKDLVMVEDVLNKRYPKYKFLVYNEKDEIHPSERAPFKATYVRWVIVKISKRENSTLEIDKY